MYTSAIISPLQIRHIGQKCRIVPKLEGRLVPNLLRTHFSSFTHCHFICVRCGCL
jgi:hypothetical protein